MTKNAEPETSLDLTLRQVLARPCQTEFDVWKALAETNNLSIPDCIRVVMAEAAGRPELFDQVRAAQAAAKAERSRNMQRQRWAHRPAPAAQPQPVATDLDAPFEANTGDDLDAPLEE